MTDQQQQEIDALRDQWLVLGVQLTTAVSLACLGSHRPVQHRDRRPPWCHACGRDALGRWVER